MEEAKANGHILKVAHFNSVLNFFVTDEATAILSDFVEKSASPLATIATDFAAERIAAEDTPDHPRQRVNPLATIDRHENATRKAKR